jgi:quercetin dioxygenase-like cupin family protein
LTLQLTLHSAYDLTINKKSGRNVMFKTSIIVAVAALAIGGVAFAQNQMAPVTQTAGLKRIPLQKFDVPPGERETVQAIAEIAPNTDVARHTHPGPEVDYILEGDLTLTVGNEPPKTYKAGDGFYVAQGTPHAAKSGPNGAKVLATYIVEKGKPLATPAP